MAVVGVRPGWCGGGGAGRLAVGRGPFAFHCGGARRLAEGRGPLAFHLGGAGRARACTMCLQNAPVMHAVALLRAICTTIFFLSFFLAFNSSEIPKKRLDLPKLKLP